MSSEANVLVALAAACGMVMGYTLGRIRPWQAFRQHAWDRAVFRSMKTRSDIRIAFALFVVAYPVRAFKAFRDRNAPPKPRREVALNPRFARKEAVDE